MATGFKARAGPRSTSEHFTSKCVSPGRRSRCSTPIDPDDAPLRPVGTYPRRCCRERPQRRSPGSSSRDWEAGARESTTDSPKTCKDNTMNCARSVRLSWPASLPASLL
jgi:hypothetical protein